MSAFDSDDEAPDLIEVPSSSKIIPVTLLSGFLGSGKTTLLNHILTSNHGKRIAVIENEFSEGLGVESMIAKSGVNGKDISNFFELPNGCICCTLKDDLLTTLEQLLLHQDRFDYILIETTGLANPGPVISTFWTDDGLHSCLKLDGVVCVVDTLNILQYLETADIATDVQLQICYADRIILNKVDLVPPEKIIEVKSVVQAINGLAVIQHTNYSAVNLDFVLNINNYSSNSEIQQKSNDIVANLVSSQFLQCIPCDPTGNTGDVKPSYLNLLTENSTVGHIANEMRTFSFKISGEISLRSLQLCLDRLLYSGEATSLSHVQQSNVKFNTVAEIYRIKGILHLSSRSGNDGDDVDYTLLHSVQAVHQLFEIVPTTFKRGEVGDITEGKNLFIFIGKQLDRNFIEDELKKCVV